MKIELFVALLVLLASTNVFGQTDRSDPIQTGKTGLDRDQGVIKSERIVLGGTHDGGDRNVVTSEKIVIGRPHEGDSSKTIIVPDTDNRPIKTIETVHKENVPVTIVRDETRPTIVGEETVPVTVVTDDTKRPTDGEHGSETRPKTDEESSKDKETLHKDGKNKKIDVCITYFSSK
jgi:hypothetical protein